MGHQLNPFVIVQSGRPFNITLGRDINGDTFNTERPSLAPAGTVCDDSNKALFRCTPFGNFKLTFAPGDVMIPRNFGEGPGSTTVNLRVSKTWSFGSEGGSRNAGQQNRQMVSATRVASARSWAAAACVVRVVVDQVVQAAADRAVVVVWWTGGRWFRWWRR